MVELTGNEEKHEKSLAEIRSIRSFRGEYGEARSMRELSDLRPLEQYSAEWAGAALDPRTLGCALRFTGLGARWELSPGGGRPKIMGDFHVVHLAEVLSWGAEAPLTAQQPTEFQLRFLSELRPIDYTRRSGAGMVTYMRVEGGRSTQELWYSDRADIGGDPYPPQYLKLDLDYCSYLDALLLTKGTYGWQYLFADIVLRRELEQNAEMLSGMLEMLPGLFPENDYTGLRERLEERL